MKKALRGNEFLAEPLVIANTDFVKQQPWFQVQKYQKLRDHMFAAERNPKTLTVKALPGGVFSHVEDYTPLLGNNLRLFSFIYGGARSPV